MIQVSKRILISLLAWGTIIFLVIGEIAFADQATPVTLTVVASDGNLTLSIPMLGSTLILKTSSRFAGAISSLVFDGKEFINSTDHGRELQSDVFFDNYGVCYNPTEAGSRADGAKDTTSSVLKFFRVQGNQIWITTQMAFWLQPDQLAYPAHCGSYPNLKRAVNKTILSNVLLKKHIIIGIPGFPNVIKESITFDVPSTYCCATFEVLTGYMPKDFSQAFYFDPQTMKAKPAQGHQGEQRYPVILATNNHQYAMGIFSPGLPQPDWPNAGYGAFTFSAVNKWNCVYRYRDVQAKPYHFICFVVVGNLTEVENTLHRLDVKYG